MVAAFVLIEVGPTTGWGDASTLHSALHAVPGVKTVHFLAGPTDVIAFLETADQKTLIEAVGKIRAVKGVAGTDTRMVWPV